MTETTVDLSGRVVLVTGAGDGLGAALARAAGAGGAEVLLLGRTVRKLEAVYDHIVADGGTPPAICPLDLEGARPDDYADIAERIEVQCGRLDAIAHCAAMLGPQTPLQYYDPLEWARVLQVNLTGPLLLTRALVPLLRAGRSPAVVFVGDRRRSAYWGAYGVSKAGLAALADILGDELDTPPRVRVTCIEPGPMRTNLRASAFPGELADEVASPESVVPRLLEAMTPG